MAIACIDGADLVHAINGVRERVVGMLADFLDLSARMREFEDTFAAQVLHTAQQLHELVQERQRLEAQFRRISQKIDRNEYESPAEIRRDIDAILTAPEAEPLDHPSAGAAGRSSTEDSLDQASKDRIVREFRRIVLPNVHPDTSDTPYPVFEAAFSAYRSSDYTLMEAFVIQYRGEAHAADDPSPLPGRLRDYRAAKQRLETRYHELRRAATDIELRDPAQARERMRQQHEEFQRAIVEEAERVQDLRSRLEALKDGSE